MPPIPALSGRLRSTKTEVESRGARDRNMVGGLRLHVRPRARRRVHGHLPSLGHRARFPHDDARRVDRPYRRDAGRRVQDRAGRCRGVPLKPRAETRLGRSLGRGAHEAEADPGYRKIANRLCCLVRRVVYRAIGTRSGEGIAPPKLMPKHEVGDVVSFKVECGSDLSDWDASSRPFGLISPLLGLRNAVRLNCIQMD